MGAVSGVPLQGLDLFGAGFPGRCPGLVWDAPLGLLQCEAGGQCYREIDEVTGSFRIILNGAVEIAMKIMKMNGVRSFGALRFPSPIR